MTENLSVSVLYIHLMSIWYHPYHYLEDHISTGLNILKYYSLLVITKIGGRNFSIMNLISRCWIKDDLFTARLETFYQLIKSLKIHSYLFINALYSSTHTYTHSYMRYEMSIIVIVVWWWSVGLYPQPKVSSKNTEKKITWKLMFSNTANTGTEIM